MFYLGISPWVLLGMKMEIEINNKMAGIGKMVGHANGARKESGTQKEDK